MINKIKQWLNNYLQYQKQRDIRIFEILKKGKSDFLSNELKTKLFDIYEYHKDEIDTLDEYLTIKYLNSNTKTDSKEIKVILSHKDFVNTITSAHADQKILMIRK